VNYLITGKKFFMEASVKRPAPPQRDTQEVVKSEELKKDDNKIPAPDLKEPVEKIILVYKNNTFRILDPSGE
jgi:hypothetical protein